MSNKRIERQARLWFSLVLLLVAVGVGAWLLLTSVGQTTYRLQTDHPVSGLIRDAPVEFHGVQVGTVEEVRLLDPRSVEILLSVDTDAPITRATAATITSRGLMPRGFAGYVYIALEDTGTDHRPLQAAAGERYPTLPTITALDMTLDAEIRRANELMHSLLDQTTLSALKQAVESIQRISTVLAENDAKLNSLLVNTERASSELKPLLESSGHSIRALQTQVLPEAYKALRQLEEFSQSMSGIATTIGRDPSVLLRGTAAPSSGSAE